MSGSRSIFPEAHETMAVDPRDLTRAKVKKVRTGQPKEGAVGRRSSAAGSYPGRTPAGLEGAEGPRERLS